MSGEARISGRITITPPITWLELYDKPWATNPTGYPDVKIRLEMDETHTPAGVHTSITGVAIEPTGHETSASDLETEVDRIVTEFAVTPDGGAPRAFKGFLHVTWGQGQDLEIYRVIVRDGKTITINPVMTWPEGARDEDSTEE